MQKNVLVAKLDVILKKDYDLYREVTVPAKTSDSLPCNSFSSPAGHICNPPDSFLEVDEICRKLQASHHIVT